MRRTVYILLAVMFLCLVFHNLIWWEIDQGPTVYHANSQDCGGHFPDRETGHVLMKSYPPMWVGSSQYCLTLPVEQPQSCSDRCARQCGGDRDCFYRCMQNCGK